MIIDGKEAFLKDSIEKQKDWERGKSGILMAINFSKLGNNKAMSPESSRGMISNLKFYTQPNY